MKIFIKSISLICLMLIFTQKIFTIGKGDYNAQSPINNDDELALSIAATSLDETESKRDRESKEEQETKSETESTSNIHSRIMSVINSLESRESHIHEDRKQEHIQLVIDALTGDVNQKNSEGETALMYAALSNYTDIIELLLEKGANPNLQNNSGTTALVYSVRFNPENLVSYCNPENIVKILLNFGANPNLQTYDHGLTPLMYATALGRINLVEILLNANADINIRDKSGTSALMRAIIGFKAKIVTLLLNARADLNLKNNNNESAIYIAEHNPFRFMRKKLHEIKKMLEDAQLQRKLEPHIRRSVRKKIMDTKILPLELAELISEYAVCPKPAKKNIK